MYLAESRDSLGVPVNNIGKSGSYAPILCNPSVWKAIVAMLDSAKTQLTSGDSATVIPLTFPAGFLNTASAAGSSTLTVRQFRALTLALLGKAEVEYAFAIGRAANGAPDQTQLAAAVNDIQASAIYSATLNQSEAVPESDIGAFFVFSTASGDRVSPIFNTVATSWFLYNSALAQFDTSDARFQAKFKMTADGQPSATEVSYKRPDGVVLGSPWFYKDLSGSAPVVIVRNIELQFLLAQAQLGLGQPAAAAATVDKVRTVVGGLSSGLGSVNVADFASVRDFLLAEQRVSLIGEGTGDHNIAMREYGLVKSTYTDWNTTDSPTADFQSSVLPLPSAESDARNGAVACVNQ
jgi:hypothetical protein